MPVPDVMMPNSLLLPAAASEKSERDTPVPITAEGSGKYSGMAAYDLEQQKTHFRGLHLRWCSEITAIEDRKRKQTNKKKKHRGKKYSKSHMFQCIFNVWLSVTALGGPKC